MSDHEPVPRGTDFSSVVVSSVPMVVQHTRLDSRQPALALLSTIVHPLDERMSRKVDTGFPKRTCATSKS